MLSFAGSLKVYVALEPVDMRKSFNGLCAKVSDEFGQDPKDGALFVFANRRRNLLKILYFDGSGLWVAAKRLEKGTFSWPKVENTAQKKLNMTPEALSMLTDGIDLKNGTFRPWYERKNS